MILIISNRDQAIPRTTYDELKAENQKAVRLVVKGHANQDWVFSVQRSHEALVIPMSQSKDTPTLKHAQSAQKGVIILRQHAQSAEDRQTTPLKSKTLEAG
jgi:hypothetical protein